MGLQGIVSKRRDRRIGSGQESEVASNGPRQGVGPWRLARWNRSRPGHCVPWGAPCVIELNLHANATTTPKVRPTSSAASMTLVIQRAEHRDTEAIHAKLDELLQADSAANNKVMRIDDKDAEEVERAGSQSLVATVQIVDAPLR